MWWIMLDEHNSKYACYETVFDRDLLKLSLAFLYPVEFP